MISHLWLSVFPPTGLPPLSLDLRFPGQILACGVGFWFPESVSYSIPLPPQNLLSHWLLTRFLQPNFDPYFFRLSDVVKFETESFSVHVKMYRKFNGGSKDLLKRGDGVLYH